MEPLLPNQGQAGQARARRLSGAAVVGALVAGAVASTSASARPPPPVAYHDQNSVTDGSTPPVVPPALAPDPDSPVRPHWDDADNMAYLSAVGTIGMCETVARPLLLVPALGATGYVAAEWICIAPAAVAVDYFQIFHGGRDLTLYESGTALLAAKLVRDVTRLPVVVSYTTAAAATLVVGTLVALTGGATALPVQIPEDYQPIALTGFLTSQALLTTLLDALRELVVFYTYHGTLGLLSEPEEARAEQVAIQDEAWLPRDLNPLTRLWALGAVAGGSRPKFSLLHIIPVVGRIIWAIDASEVLQQRMRRLARDSLKEKRTDDDLFWMDMAIYGLYGVDAGVAIVTDLVLLTSIAIWTVGTAAFLFGGGLLPPDGQSLTLRALGTAGVALGSAAVVLVVLKDVKGAIAPWLIPLAYGPLSPGAQAKLEAFFADDEEEGEGSPPPPPAW